MHTWLQIACIQQVFILLFRLLNLPQVGKQASESHAYYLMNINRELMFDRAESREEYIPSAEKAVTSDYRVSVFLNTY